MGKRHGIIGSRDYQRLAAVVDFVNRLPVTTTVVSGGARGVDTVAEDTARHRVGMPAPVVLRPDYERYGRYEAPKKRNQALIDTVDELTAFWDGCSTGTKDALWRASIKHLPVTIVYPTVEIKMTKEEWEALWS